MAFEFLKRKSKPIAGHHEETPEEKWRDTAVSWKDSAQLHSTRRGAIAERLRQAVRNHRKGRKAA